VPLVFLTHVTKSLNVKKAIDEINNLDIIHEKALVIRVENNEVSSNSLRWHV